MLPKATVNDPTVNHRRISPFHVAVCVLAAWISYATGIHLLTRFELPNMAIVLTHSAKDADAHQQPMGNAPSQLESPMHVAVMPKHAVSGEPVIR